MKKKQFILISLAFVLAALPSFGQENKEDTLKATVFTSTQQGNYLSKGKDLRTEVVSTAGLHKMACCNLGDSFENSASVSVGYSDATTGARQIRLLGLSGIYTQMLDENRPMQRGLSSPFGLSYVPGSWLESIQIAKGSPSVINGVESMTGQINLEHRKPTDEKPLFVNGSVMNDTKADLNVISSLQLSDELSTALLGHVDGNFKTHDMNGDSFVDEPALLQFDVASRWLYYTPETMIHWGVKAVKDSREGGQRTGNMFGKWLSDIDNSQLNGYFKIGHYFNEAETRSLALIGDYTFQKINSTYGHNLYNAGQHSGFMNLIFRNEFSESHDLTVGINALADMWNESLAVSPTMFFNQVYSGHESSYWRVSPYVEYTLRNEEKFSMIADLAGVFDGGEPFRLAPRLTLKWQPTEWLVLRGNGGRGLRRANPITDNLGIMSTGKDISGNLVSRPLEDSWTYGGNATVNFTDKTYLSLDFFRTSFTRQLLLDRESPDIILFYDLDGHLSRSNNFQLDFSTEPVERLTFTVTGRLSDAVAWQPSGEVREVALNSRLKGVFNAQYKTRLSRWIFDFTASINGSSRVYDFMKDLRDSDGALLYPDGKTEVYPLLYAQVTRRFKGFDVYLGGENLTGYTQKMPIINAGNPFSKKFDAASIWGPLMGAKIYAGFRVTIWK